MSWICLPFRCWDLVRFWSGIHPTPLFPSFPSPGLVIINCAAAPAPSALFSFCVFQWDSTDPWTFLFSLSLSFHGVVIYIRSYYCEVYNSVAFPVLQCCGATTSISEAFYHPKEIATASEHWVPILPFPSPENHQFAFCLLGLAPLDIPYEWNHTVCGLLCLASLSFGWCVWGSSTL